MTTTLLSITALAAGVGHIGARLAGRERAAFWLKPVPILLFVAIAMLAAPPVSPVYRALIVGGLLFSLAGDVLLALPREQFVVGLASFLVAHLWYIGAFLVRGSGAPVWWPLAPALVYGAIILLLLWPHVERPLRPAVAVYMAVILIMGWQAAELWLARADASAGLALLGALCFIVSDSALAWDKFRRRFVLAPVVVMVTYYAAQWLLALSVR